jgi:hypothetical protein
MNTDTIIHGTLLRLIEAGAVRHALALGVPGGWLLIVKYGLIERTLAAQRSGEPRIFRKLDTLVNYLRELGIVRLDVDAANFNFDPDAITRRRRPDRAEALRRLHRGES